MEAIDKKHLGWGLAFLIAGVCSLGFGFPCELSSLIAMLLCGYIVLLLVQCARRAHSEGTDTAIFSLPNRTWALLLITFLLTANVSVFASMYLGSKGVSHEKNGEVVIMDSKRDAIYFSAVTLTTLGYGDFVPNEKGRMLVVFHLVSGTLTLLLIIPVVASRVFAWP